MAIRKMEDIRPDATFALRLFHLGGDMCLLGPAAIASALYENDECFKLVHPKDRSVRRAVNREKDIATIARRVQDHFDVTNAYDVPGNYMMAYSILFDCSMDYLYGKVSEKCPNVEVLDISKKTGLSVEAVKHLMENETVCLKEYLQAVNNYNLLDWPEKYGTYDPELDDYFFDTDVSVSKFWSELIESELFTQLPKNWSRMACALYTCKAIKMVAEDAEKEMDEFPTLENFLSWVETWETFHPDQPLARIHGLTWEETYEKDPEFVKQVYRELRHEHYYSSVERSEDYETAYWGCAGKFDRHTMDFFHNKAEDWCTSGPMPNYWKDETRQ